MVTTIRLMTEDELRICASTANRHGMDRGEALDILWQQARIFSSNTGRTVPDNIALFFLLDAPVDCMPDWESDRLPILNRALSGNSSAAVRQAAIEQYTLNNPDLNGTDTDQICAWIDRAGGNLPEDTRSGLKTYAHEYLEKLQSQPPDEKEATGLCIFEMPDDECGLVETMPTDPSQSSEDAGHDFGAFELLDLCNDATQDDQSGNYGIMDLPVPEDSPGDLAVIGDNESLFEDPPPKSRLHPAPARTPTFGATPFLRNIITIGAARIADLKQRWLGR
ncbi:MAG: hypothetical protein EYC62_08645 [Alphaproteobacteria bacterium]|nr:MAG: hypothetical protein EYC62_08645 [Alphaproteobacteria bacterium]